MIRIIEGVVGGGKTYWAVREAMRLVAGGGVVYSNVDFNPTGCRRYIAQKYGLRMQKDQIRRLPPMEQVLSWYKPDVIQWGTLECPVTVILDETHLFWNARDYANTAKTQKDMLSFLTQSRKAGIDVIFISQDEGNIDRQFRVLAEVVTLCRNMGKNKIPVFGVGMKGWHIFETKEAVNGSLLGREWHQVDRGIFGCYKTEAFLDSLMSSMSKVAHRIERRKLESGITRRFRLGILLRTWGGLDRKIGTWLCVSALKKARKKKQRGQKNESDSNPDPCNRRNRLGSV